MSLALKWLKDFWYIPVFFVVSIILWIVFRRRGNPLGQTLAELQAIEAARDIKEYKAIAGAEAAKMRVERRYHVELLALNEKQEKQAEKLRDDPAALAKFIVRASSGD